MTTAHDRYLAVRQSRRFLEELCDPGRTPRVPSIVRNRARALLKHYPMDWEIDSLSERNQEILDRQPLR